MNAIEVLERGARHVGDRSQTYDAHGERSMLKTVEAFNALTNLNLTTEQGWLFMVCLKASRTQQGAFRSDNYEDGAAYFALMCEEASYSQG